MIARERHEMDEGHEYAERADQAGHVEADEAPRSDRLTDCGAAGLHGSRRELIAVGIEPAARRIVLDQQRHATAEYQR